VTRRWAIVPMATGSDGEGNSGGNSHAWISDTIVLSRSSGDFWLVPAHHLKRLKFKFRPPSSPLIPIGPLRWTTIGTRFFPSAITITWQQSKRRAVPIGPKGAASYILSHQPKSFDWRTRNAQAHPLKRVPESSYVRACESLNQIIEIGS